MKSHQAIADAVEQKGAKHVASALGVSLSLVYKWAEPQEASGAANPLDRVAQLRAATDSLRPLQWLCEEAGGYFVCNPTPDSAQAPAILVQTRTLLKEFSDLLQEVSSAVDDGHVSLAEAGRIRTEWEGLKRVAEGLVAAAERSARDGTGT
jgi:hypothetical protein